ncbi:cation:proton antiporter [Candidatus Gottesmanbacteria bacterium]|nr:cation:proton antiporter [Candidatus Gottesmanbacteria bacterium]
MEPHSISLITTLLLVFTAAIVGGIIAHSLRLPMIIGYISAGLVAGTVAPGILEQSFLRAIADSGVTLLLFTLGVEFSFVRLRPVLRSVFWAAVAQIVVCSLLFLFAGFALKLPFLPSFFVAIAGSLSSTAVVIKLLSERGELDTVPGQIATGWLVIQDLAVVPIMLLLPAVASVVIGNSVTIPGAMWAIGKTLVFSITALAVIVFLGKTLIPRLLGKVASVGSREIFVLFTVGLVFLAGITTYSLGMSAALGAFIAGLLVAETSQNHAIFSEIRPLRDIFAVVFFVSLGMTISVSSLAGMWPVILSLAVSMIVVKSVVVYGLSRYVGYHRKTAFLVGLYLGQLSEFGFIIAAVGASLGVLTSSDANLIVSLVFMTILLNAPVIAHGHRLYYWVYHTLGSRWPRIFRQGDEQFMVNREELPLSDHIVICGYGRVGKYIGRALQMANIPFLVVDYDQTTVAALKAKSIAVIFGDPADTEVLDYAQVDRARAIIIAIPDKHTQEMIIAHAQTLNRRIKILCRCHHEEDQRHLKSLGVHTIVQPEFEAAISIVSRVLSDFGVPADDLSGKISRLKIEHGVG